MLIKYISIKQTIGRFFKDLGIDETSYINDIPQWTEDAIQIIGIPNYYVYKFHKMKIDQNRGTLPCDIENLHSFHVTNDFTDKFNINTSSRLFIRNAPLIGNGISSPTCASGYATVNGNFLHTSFYKGFVYAVYTGIPLDCDGFPLVPKDAKLNEALQYYFIQRMSLSGFKHPILDYAKAFQLWEKTYPEARNSVNWMDLQDYQDFTEMWNNVLLGDLNANNYIN